MSRPMMFSQFQQSTAILILSVSLGAVPSLAQANNAKTPDNAGLPAPPGKVVEDIVARVNDQIITSSDYDRAAEQLEAEARQQAVPAQRAGTEKSRFTARPD